MVFENHRKSLIQHCERTELRLHFPLSENLKFCPKKKSIYVYILSGQKFIKNGQLGEFEVAVKQCYQKGHFYLDRNW